MKEIKPMKNKVEPTEVKQLMKKIVHLKIKGVSNLLMEKMDMDVVEAYNKKKEKDAMQKASGDGQ